MFLLLLLLLESGCMHGHRSVSRKRVNFRMADPTSCSAHGLAHDVCSMPGDGAVSRYHHGGLPLESSRPNNLCSDEHFVPLSQSEAVMSVRQSERRDAAQEIFGVSTGQAGDHRNR